jgi:hypothetical protein
MTLKKASLELSSPFAPGQVYTAVSRVKSIVDLFMLGNIRMDKSASKGMASPEAVLFEDGV